MVQRLRALADSREPRFNYHGGSKPSVTPAPDLTPSSGLRLASEGNRYVVHKHACEQNTKHINQAGQVWQFTPVIPALAGQRQEDQELKINLDYMRPCLKKKRKKVSTQPKKLIL